MKTSNQLFTRTRNILLAVLLTAITFLGCKTKKANLETELGTSSVTAHVAFAGGGWRAHTGHSAWTIALLNKGQRSLSNVFANVNTIGSNSGGSWFSTMLTFSNSFVTAIQASNAASTWATTGWLGQQQYLFDNAGCSALSGDEFLACVFDTYTGSIANATKWDLVVQDLVFHDYPLSQNIKLNGSRQSWANGKPLLLASSLLTTEVVLNGTLAGDKQYYQACLSPAMADLDRFWGSSCTGGPTPLVAPITFSNIPSTSGYQKPPFLSAAHSSYYNVGYTQNSLGTPQIAGTTIHNPIINDEVPVVIAAAASSAAAGFAASAAVSGHWVSSFEAEDEALSFQLANSKAVFIDADNMSVQTLANNKVVRIADGGAVDNSGVAQIVSFLQQNNRANGFRIVAFDNVETVYSPGAPAADIGTDIAYLFGKGLSNGNQICSGVNGTGTCITVPDLQIFEINALTTTPATWVASNSSTKLQKLIYTKYTVTTKENKTFGITGGVQGTLHAFTCAWEGADTAPQNNTTDGDFIAYANMFDFINSALNKDNGKGLQYLENAMGL